MKSEDKENEKVKLERSYNFLDFHKFLPYLFFGTFLVLCALVVYVYSSYMYAFFISGILFILFRTPHRWLLQKLNERRSLAAFISTTGVLLILVIPAILLVISLFTEARHAAQLGREWFTQEKLLELYQQNSWIKDRFNLTSEQLLAYRLQVFDTIRSNSFETIRQGWVLIAGSIRIFIDFTFALFILFFLFRSVGRIGQVIYSNLPFPDRIEKHIGDRMIKIFDAVVKGNLMVSILQGTVIGIVFWLCGLSTPLLWGAIATPFALIPVIGTAVVWLPGALYLFSQGESTTAIIMGITCLVAYFTLENLVKPLVLDKSLNLHPLFLFLAIVGGLNAFGIKGLILGPFIVTMFVTVWQLVSEWNRSYSELESDTPEE